MKNIGGEIVLKWYSATRSTLEYKINITFLNKSSFQFHLIVLLPFSHSESHVSPINEEVSCSDGI
jgi:hypothetical protein